MVSRAKSVCRRAGCGVLIDLAGYCAKPTQLKALQTTVLSGPVATVEAETKLYGTRQDFSFWF